jgi:hypothetical protein
MNRKLALAVVLMGGGWSTAFAQVNSCVVGVTQDACQKAVDIFQYLAPQLGSAITGGNATLGQGGALGGLGHFSLGLRVNAVKGSLPQIDDASATPVPIGARATPYRLEDAPVPMPTIDGSFGIFRGFPVGVTNVGGLDLLVSASYIPKIEKMMSRSIRTLRSRLAMAPASAFSGIDCVARRFGDVSQARFASSLIDGRVEWRDTPRERPR